MERPGSGNVVTGPDSSAVRTALWRALHVELDNPPHLINDTIGAALVAPEPGWRDRPDMHREGTAPYRIGIVARTRFVEDLVTDSDIDQYVLLGAGLDTFAQRHPDADVDVFEIDQHDTQAWKRQRLIDLGYGISDRLHLVPADFDADNDWWNAIVQAGFDPRRPAVVSSSGVSMYITRNATIATLRQLANLAPGSTVAMTFMLPFELVDEPERSGLEAAARGASSSGTPWISFYTPDDIIDLAEEAGFGHARSIPILDIAGRYDTHRLGQPSPATGEALLLADT